MLVVESAETLALRLSFARVYLPGLSLTASRCHNWDELRGVTALSGLQGMTIEFHSRSVQQSTSLGTQQYLWPEDGPQPQAVTLSLLPCLPSSPARPPRAPVLCITYIQPPTLTGSKNTKLGPICLPTEEHRCAMDFRGDWQTVKAVRSSTCCLLPISPFCPTPSPGRGQGNILRLTYKKLHLPSGRVGDLGSS